jgi:alpha-tubulin suppressor-like RCC1 family protein
MIAIMNDGSARSWGSQANGRGGAGYQDVGRTFPTRVAFPPGTPPVTDIYNVWAQTYLITADGMVWSCGIGDSNLGGNNATNNPIPKKLQGFGDLGSTTKIVKVRGAYGDSAYPQAMLLDDQGRVYVLGMNQYGSLGIAGTANVPRLLPFTETVPIREMTMQGSLYGASMLISRDGDLYIAGNPSTSGWGQVEINSHRLWMPWGQDKKVKMTMMSETDAHWAAGYNPYRTQGVVLENGDLYVWGDVGGQYGSGWGINYTSDIWPGNQYHPRKVLDGVVDYGAVQGGYHKHLAVRDDGTVWGAGDSNYNVITPARQTWAQEGVGVISNATRLTMMGSQYSATAGVLTSDGTVIMWGHDDTGGFGTGDAVSRSSTAASPALIPERIVDFQWVGYFAVSQPYFTTIFLTETGQVYASGSGYYGVNGDDDSENCYSPRQILF